MLDGYKKYIPFKPVNIKNRQWPSKVIDHAPIWCSVDLRDGNQSLIDPMNLEEKLEMFRTLVDIGIKEIEIGFPSASETEYTILRTLIEKNLIPDNVTLQVLVQAREHLIDKTFESIKGAKNVIIHLYNATSTKHRKIVFKKDIDGIIDIAVSGAKMIRERAEKLRQEEDINIRFEYSPEGFSETESDYSVKICNAVIEEWLDFSDEKIIVNLPATVESSTPNGYADQVELFCSQLKNRDKCIISLHPHNDRGTAVATAELGLLAGAERIEGTLFGNGERTGNVDIVTLALNMYTQAIDPKLDFSDINKIRDVYEKTTKMHIDERHPYVGDLVFTAFSGSHQDAISKGHEYMKNNNSPYWEVPYLPIDPADLGREYEPIIRINSQSGKGGAAFIMAQTFGYNMPKAMHPEFGKMVKAYCDKTGKEISPQEVFSIFEKEYINISGPYSLLSHKLSEENELNDKSPKVKFSGTLQKDNDTTEIEGIGNGPIDAFFNAVSKVGIVGYKFVDYSEHAVSFGSDAKAVSYIHLIAPNGKNYFGVGISHNINYASIRGVLCAINRSIADKN